MNLVEEEGAYGDKEEEEEDEEEEQTNTNKLLFSSQFSSSSSLKYPHQNNSWLHQDSQNFDKMDLSLATTTSATTIATNIEEIDQNSVAGGSCSAIEKEHMFDKVVTPSDVGKLNRLVIPKQHAEKYFPLDSSSNEKGLLLNFEDRNGKPWRFRYSYWNSSQSYVMTKGWSRFVKEKKLDAGDIVSFQRGIGESAKTRLFIDWRRRPNMVSDPSSFMHLDHQIQQNPSISFPSTASWTGRLYPLPHPQFHFNSTPNFLHHHHLTQYPYNSSTRYYDLRAPQPQVQVQPLQPPLLHHHQPLPMVLDSVPVVHGKTVGKRLRLFGVNMECSPTQHEDNESPNSGSSNSVHHLTMQTEFSKKGKSINSSSSLSVDLDL